MARIVAISNQKGGVGKTTTAINLSAALAELGQRVLLVDMDPQGNASSGVGFARNEVPMGVYDALMGNRDASECIMHTQIPGLDVLPGSPDMCGAELDLIDETARERRLRKALLRVRGDYDWVFIDCPPSLGLLTINALVAADSVLVPLQAEYYALEGLSELLRLMSFLKERLNPDVVREGVVLTLADRRTNLCQAVEEDVREMLGDEVFQTIIPRNVRLGEAPSFGKPITSYDRRSMGAQSYIALARELLARHGMTAHIASFGIEAEPITPVLRIVG